MYYPKLDSIRCYAAFAVVFAHILKIWTWDPLTFILFPLGNTGVVVFFVLSGFLITSILMNEPPDKSRSLSFKHFYMRRSLRIFPIYYLYLVVVFSLNVDGIHDTGAYPWVYLTNFWIFNNDHWPLSNSHLWTLSMEEQFYLVWPVLVFFLRQRIKALFGVLGAICLISIGTRFYLSAAGYSISPQIEVFTFANMDFLAVGGLLALGHREYGKQLAGYALPVLLGGLGLYYFTFWLHESSPVFVPTFWGFGKFGLGLATAGVLLLVIHSKDGAVKSLDKVVNNWSLFHNPVTVHLGTISYGIYLYHNPIVAHYQGILGVIGIDPGPSLFAKIVCCLIMVIAVAEFSYVFVEKPCLRLKNNFR